MSEALNLDLTQFDDSPRPGSTPDGNTPARIGKVLGEAGIHVPSTLYNEALALAREGHLGQAQGRLQMLLCLDPEDGDAHMLLARLHSAQGRWADALARLDTAMTVGVVPPAGFRETLEGQIRDERLREEENRARVSAREQGEFKALRHETRTLRGENIRLETELGESRERERAWKLASIASGAFGIVVISLLLFTGGGAAPTAAPTTEVAAAEAPVAAEEAVMAAEAGASAYVAPKPAVEAPAPAQVAPREAVAPREVVPAGGVVHVVAQNETLYKLAARYYGDKTKWTRIRDANPALGADGTKLKLGMKLTIPQ